MRGLLQGYHDCGSAGHVHSLQSSPAAGKTLPRQCLFTSNALLGMTLESARRICLADTKVCMHAKHMRCLLQAKEQYHRELGMLIKEAQYERSELIVEMAKVFEVVEQYQV